MPEYVAISRDPFARHDVVRQVVPAYDRRPCYWCGNRPGKFRYGIDPDGILPNRTHWQTHAYCCVSCMRDSEGG